MVEPAPDREGALQGAIERVTYRHPETGYCVLKLAPERGFGDPEALFSVMGERATAVGNGPELAEGQRVRLVGAWSAHPQHGRQFRFDGLTILPPLGEAGVARYLASSAFRGIGPKLAERIVAKLGTNALARIRDEPDALVGIPGLRGDVREELVAAIRAELGAQEFLAFLFGLGLGPVQAGLVVKKLGRDGEARLRANPYLLATGIRGIGFPTADKVALQLGVKEDSQLRRRAALVFTLGEAARDGHSALEAERLIAAAHELVGLDGDDAWRAALAELEENAAQNSREDDSGEHIVVERELREGAELVYLPRYHTSEARLAANLATLVRAGPARPWCDPVRLAQAERQSGLELHADQRAAVLGLLAQPVALLTGGPGVGKTTIVRLVVELAEKNDARIALASPTGRAAKRLAEATGREASTIHRLLGWDPHQGGFAHHAKKPLEADLVIVDEISMLDVILAHHLVKAIQPPTRLILVGDPDQLPSVSAGNVLASLLACGQLPVHRLTRIYRQAAESRIVTNAHRILAGDMPEFPDKGDPPSDFYFFPAESDHEAAARLIDVVTRRIPERFGFDWVRDVQVLSPMYRGACGVDHLNERLRGALGIGGTEVQWRGRTWRVGDRVIQTRNDYDKGVFNGDMGRILRIQSDGQALVVRYPEREVVYARENFIDLSPAFAITVHRSQGGEFPVVVIPLVTQHFTMLQRHLLYTAVTRAKELVVIVGSLRALQLAVENADQSLRESGLAERLEALLQNA